MRTVVGVDPGPVPGIAVLSWEPGGKPMWRVYQVAASSPSLVYEETRRLLDRWLEQEGVSLAAESYVVSARSARTADRGAQQTTNDLAALLRHAGARMRPPSEVKPWATDARLKSAGADILQQMRHARDAARHALYSACRDRGLPDPLSRAYRSLK